MTEEEILKLSAAQLLAKAKELTGRDKEEQKEHLLGKPMFVVWDPIHDIDAAMELFNEIYNPMSKIRHGAWVLSTIDNGKDCSLATLFFGAPSRRARRQGRKNRPLKAQAKAKKKQMARAITLCYVMALEGVTVDLRYQPEEA